MRPLLALLASILVGFLAVTAGTAAYAGPTGHTRGKVIGRAGHATPSAFPMSTASEPPPCEPALLRGRTASAISAKNGTALIIKISAARHQCVIASGGWPVVRLHIARGASPVAKAFQFTPEINRRATPFVTYTSHGVQRAVLVLGPRRSAFIVLLLGREHRVGQACGWLTSATIYPAPAATGTGENIKLRNRPAMCGEPRILMYMAGRLAGVQSVARGALGAMMSPAPGLTPANDSPAGFWYGSDGAKTMACPENGGASPYQISSSSLNDPRNGDCSHGTNGVYGGYFEEIGRYDHWQSCDSNGIGQSGPNYTAAQVDLVSFGDGIGASPYWVMAGPGFLGSPAYQDSGLGLGHADYDWGLSQANQANTLAGSTVRGDSGYLFADIEQYPWTNHTYRCNRQRWLA
jgi:hypothetical protein